MEQPEGYRSEEHPDYACKLKKSLYGLKLSARCWNTALDSYLKSNSYKQLDADSCLYMKTVKMQNGKINFVILSIHVDDILIFSNDVVMLEDEKRAIGTKFKVEDLGEVGHILGMLLMLIKRNRNSRTLTISQSKYLEGVLKRFNMTECKSVSTPIEPGKQFHELSESETPANIHEYQKIIGCLTYVTMASRPDLAAAVGILSKYKTKPSQEHWKGVKRFLRYIKETMNFGITFPDKGNTCILTGYSDADWANDTETRRSTSGYIFQINGSTISWCSKKQFCVESRSTTEAEYMALSFVTQEAIWLRRLLENVGVKQKDQRLFTKITREQFNYQRTRNIIIVRSI